MSFHLCKVIEVLRPKRSRSSFRTGCLRRSPRAGCNPVLFEVASLADGGYHREQEIAQWLTEFVECPRRCIEVSTPDKRLPLLLRAFRHGEVSRQCNGFEFQSRSAVRERTLDGHSNLGTIEVELVCEQPNVEEVLHPTVQGSKVDHRLELLGNNRFARIHAQSRSGKLE